ncbi:MAG: hypothetical protein AABO58_16380 [Acidobacteriota bacterium]
MSLAVFLATALATASISGKVVDDANKPLAGVSVAAYPISLTNCCAMYGFTRTDALGNFKIDVQNGVHAVVTSGYSRWNPAASRVDIGAGNVTGLVLQMRPGSPRFIDSDPPRAALLSFTSSASGTTLVTGAAGAVAPSSYVILVTLETGHLAVVQAAADGAFTAELFAPPGTSILMKADPIGFVARRALLEAKSGGEGALSGLSGTIVHVPEPPPAGGAVPFAGAASIGCCNYGSNPLLILTGTINGAAFAASDEIRVRGKIEVHGTSLTILTVNLGVSLEPIADDLGSRGPANAFFSSALTTPTGFPIERGERTSFGTGGTSANVTLTRGADGVLSGTVDLALFRPPATVRPAWFRPRLQFFSQLAQDPKGADALFVDKPTRHKRNWLYLPVVRIGSPPPPSLHWALLLDKVVEGTTGVTSVEDRGAFGVTNRIAMQGETLVVPRIDPLSGEPVRYRLEPFLPQISVGDRGIPPSVPFIPFRFPSGALTVRIRKPDGAVVTIGPAPFVQSRMSTTVDRDGNAIDQGGGHLTDPYQLTTRDPAFEVAFDSDGLHLVELEGEIEDLWGNHWSGKGTYRIHVARPIPVDTATIPGTPFEVGDAFHAGATIPGWSSCDVALDLSLAPKSRSDLRRWTIRGRANRFGVFEPSESVRFVEPGEYRAEVTATCVDAAGRAGVGVRVWGGVVAEPQQRMTAHGRRGIDGGGPQWFFRSQTSAPPIPHTHVNYPFHTGDVLWMQKADATQTAVTIQDLDGSVAPLLRSRWVGDKSGFDALAAIGEIPLFSSRADMNDPMSDPSKVDLWAYSYRSVQRPAVRVREQVTEDNTPSMYWRFHAQYGRQSGVGRNGDLPNDFKLQFAGAVLRGSAVGEPLYSIYGSLFVLVRDDDAGGTRAFPPFQGNGGGPNGGPLMTLLGKPVDIFFHPTAVRPGTVLDQGDIASFAGYSAPTLPSKIAIAVTSPSGRVRTIAGRANKIGWFYDPGSDFAVDEPGVWKAKVTIIFDGVTSAGQTTAPFPTGDVLGSREGEFLFFVVHAGAAPLSVIPSVSEGPGGAGGALNMGMAPPVPPGPSLTLGVTGGFVRPAEGPINFTITPPPGLTGLQLTYVTTMPGFILEQGTASGLTYTYEARRLVADFPNLDLTDGDGFAGADTITISFLLSGTDAAGNRKHFARQVVLQGEELQMPEQKAAPSTPRRRAVK